MNQFKYQIIKSTKAIMLSLISLGLICQTVFASPSLEEQNKVRALQKKNLVKKQIESKRNRQALPVQTNKFQSVTQNPEKLKYAEEAKETKPDQTSIKTSQDPKKRYYLEIDSARKNPYSTTSSQAGTQKKFYYKRYGINGLGAVANQQKNNPAKAKTRNVAKNAYKKKYYNKKGIAAFESYKLPHARSASGQVQRPKASE